MWSTGMGQSDGGSGPATVGLVGECFDELARAVASAGPTVIRTLTAAIAPAVGRIGPPHSVRLIELLMGALSRSVLALRGDCTARSRLAQLLRPLLHFRQHLRSHRAHAPPSIYLSARVATVAFALSCS
jgi:hypothetical protein